MKKLSGEKMDAILECEAVLGMDLETHLGKQRRLLENLEDSKELIGRVESMAHATIALIKTQGPENAFKALMSGIIEGVCLGIEIGQECSVESSEASGTFDCPNELDLERTN